jgi:mannose/fructose/N-acetylgalactosamine-specific phosphotransferase system component IID
MFGKSSVSKARSNAVAFKVMPMCKRLYKRTKRKPKETMKAIEGAINPKFDLHPFFFKRFWKTRINALTLKP